MPRDATHDPQGRDSRCRGHNDAGPRVDAHQSGDRALKDQGAYHEKRWHALRNEAIGGGDLAIVNLGETPYDAEATLVVRERTAGVLDAVRELVVV